MLIFSKETGVAMSAQSIRKRIAHITREIGALQAELDRASFASSEQGERHRLIEKYLTPDMLADLKAAVENLRLFVWKYLEAAAQKCSSPDVDLNLQSYRIQRATELLRSLGPATETRPEELSFFERIQNIAHVAIEKYENSIDGRRRTGSR